MEQLYRLLKYILQFIIVYLILRYVPQIKMNASPALLTSLILIILCLGMEYVYGMIIRYNSPEPSCDTCSIPQKDKTCHIVCDNNEGFTGALDPVNSVHPSVTSVSVHQPVQGMMTHMDKVAHQPTVQKALANEETIHLNTKPIYQHPLVNPELTPYEKSVMNPKPEAPKQEQMLMHPMFDMKPLPTPEHIVHATQQISQETKHNPHIIGEVKQNPNKNHYNNVQSEQITPIASPKAEITPEQQPYPTMGTTMKTIPFYMEGQNPNDAKTEKTYEEYNKQRERAVEENSKFLGQYAAPYQVPGAKSQINQPQQYNVRMDGNVMNEMDYSDFDYNSLPVAVGYKSFQEDYGYSYLPPESWYNKPVRAPICRTTVREPVMPMWTSGAPTDVKDFYTASQITGPQGISVSYINDKLNAGR